MTVKIGPTKNVLQRLVCDATLHVGLEYGQLVLRKGAIMISIEFDALHIKHGADHELDRAPGFVNTAVGEELLAPLDDVPYCPNLRYFRTRRRHNSPAETSR